ncbi:GNAT family N-acetyltransferase [Arcobacter lacus]|uniref:GNAT family N-acetyltransferase n=1 Tax=Arcobacter lacus TaxID=1912876 RepID=UPI0021BA5512|nr:GNAT family N-acetyltransferase [Arcobacter lacus]MCG3714150.1 GNAT family N-acetyltransferase [Aliarcobacter butzleri]MCT7908130.1 GNAT family N-acetyltransferase [Arcobacter lacus]
MSESLIFNKIPLEEIKIGMNASYSQTITDADIKAFAGISGDRNPVHLDENYAQNSKFKKRIAHGMMTASYFSALFGTKIPGEGCVYTHQSLNFKRPVYINDTVKATVTVTDIDLEKRRVKFKTVCKVDNKIVTEGESELYVPIEFNKIIINDKNELLKYKSQILELFEHSFGNKMDEKLWNWAYVDNPNGNPIVSLYFDNKKLVGHYAVIPIKFLFNQKNLNAVLSMTTMVNSAYRKYGIFIDQANEVYEKATKLGYKFVCGFPNRKSAPGFKKRLEWILEEDLYVANFSYDELQQIEKNIYSNIISFNTQDKENLEWRLSKPNQNYFKKDNNIIKDFDGNFDIVYNSFNFFNLEKDKKYNLLLNHNLDKYLDKKEFDYIFGYRLFDTSLEGIEFKKDLIMSDVF